MGPRVKPEGLNCAVSRLFYFESHFSTEITFLQRLRFYRDYEALGLDPRVYFFRLPLWGRLRRRTHYGTA
jgi:hypothetical protein